MEGFIAKYQRKLFLVLFLSEFSATIMFSSQIMFNVKSVNEALYGYSYENITNKTVLQCALHCSASCLCMSFQLCGKLCQLCSSNKVLNPEDMRENKQCTNYHFLLTKTRTQTCAINSKEASCCMTSQPCLNGGTCEAILSNEKRYKCICPFGYQGYRCEIYKEIKSCRSYNSKDNQTPGVYNISISPDGKILKVFCDFDKITSTAWTLVQSYELAMNDHFTANPLWKNSPFNNNNPSWGKYRLSYQQMDSIRKDSTKWRITCQYNPKQGTVYTDYVRGRNDVNILTFDGNCRCVFFEYINVRGQSCSNCTGCMWQSNHWTYVLDSQSGRGKCNFEPSGGATCGEDNFGYYKCKNQYHRCTQNQQATTQIWFGGK